MADPAMSIFKQPDHRPVYEYELPDELAGCDDFVKKSVGLSKLKMSEEIAASSNAGGNQTKLAYAWARAALVEVDGRRVDKSEGEDERILENTDPQIRELILSAYADMSTSSKVLE